MLRLLRQSIASAEAALVAAAALLSLSVANTQSASDSTSPRDSDKVFAPVVGDQTVVWKQREWQDFAALAYAESKRSDAEAVPWLPQPLPAVDGINGKIAGFGEGADDTTASMARSARYRFASRSNGVLQK